jgi:hypothetical protein
MSKNTDAIFTSRSDSPRAFKLTSKIQSQYN